jgi:hypothetical protein
MQITLVNSRINSELVLSEESMSFVLESVDWGAVEARHSTAPLVDTIGEEITETFLEPRYVSIVGWILGQNQQQITERKNVLNKLINPQNQMKLIYGDYVLNMKAERTIKYGTRYQENNDKMCKFILNFKAPQPLFMLKGETVSTITAIIKKFSFPINFISNNIIFGLYPNQSINNMENIGDVQTGFIITITATGDVTNPYLLNEDTGKIIKLNMPLISGDIVKISTLSGNKYIELTRAGVTSNIIGKLTRESKMFSLDAGVNHLDLNADENGGNMEVGIEYAPRFLEVQD